MTTRGRSHKRPTFALTALRGNCTAAAVTNVPALHDEDDVLRKVGGVVADPFETKTINTVRGLKDFREVRFTGQVAIQPICRCHARGKTRASGQIGTPDLIVKIPEITVKANSPDWWGRFRASRPA